MNTEIQSVIKDSEALLALAEPALKKVAQLEVSTQELTTKVASLEQQKVARDESLKTAALKAANFFESRGMLKAADAGEFATRLQNNPEQIFAVVQEFLDSSTLKEAGVSMEGSAPAEDSMDPMERFCLSK